MKFSALAIAVLALVACGGEPDEPAVAVARITCTHRMLSVDTPRVRVRPDGVHLHVKTSGAVLTVEGEPVDGGEVLELPPGAHRIRCDQGGGTSMESSFEVVGDGEAGS